MRSASPEVAARRAVLVVEDDRRTSVLLRSHLESAGYQASAVGATAEALERLRRQMPDLVLLGAGAGGGDDLPLLAEIRAVSDVPLIVVGPGESDEAVARALELGADDYVTAPFSQRELLGRVRAVIRRAEMPPPVAKREVRVDDGLRIDFARHAAVAGGREVRLRPTEYRLLYHLVNNAGRVLSHATLLAKVWGFEYRDHSHYLRLYINYLRHKIEPDPANPRYIFTERGAGYRFKEF